MNENYIEINNYKKKIMGQNINIIIIKLNNKKSNCTKHLTQKQYIKKDKLIIKPSNKTMKSIFSYYMKNKDIEKINKKDNKIMMKLSKYISNEEKYTYCLNQDNLIISETMNENNKSIVKNLFSKHIFLCKDKPCASGELVFHKNKLVFDNSSGTYKPTIDNLKSIKKALSFLNVKIIDMNDKNHSKYFGE